jgi:hypothetical protein
VIKDNCDDFLVHISSTGQTNIKDDESRTKEETASEDVGCDDVGQANIEDDERNNELKTVETNACEERKPPFDYTKEDRWTKLDKAFVRRKMILSIHPLR